MGKKSKKGRPDDVGPTMEGESGDTPAVSGAFAGAALFWIAAVAAYGHAAHVFLKVEYAPAFMGLALFLGLVGWTAGGGMGETKQFRQPSGIIGAAVALILVVVAAPFFVEEPGKKVASKPKEASATEEDPTYRPSLTKFLDKKEKSKTGGDGDSTDVPMDMSLPPQALANHPFLAALDKAGPPLPEPPPTQAQLVELGEKARRFYWGYLTGDRSILEAEASFDFGASVELASPEQGPAKPLVLEDLSVESRTYKDEKVTVQVVGPGGAKATISLTRDLGWEVTGIERAQ